MKVCAGSLSMRALVEQFVIPNFPKTSYGQVGETQQGTKHILNAIVQVKLYSQLSEPDTVLTSQLSDLWAIIKAFDHAHTID